MISNLNLFQKDIKVNFSNKSLLIKALTHKSANQLNNNEKLEFLGDRVIALILSNKLFDLYPEESEGVLDKRFANLVNRKVCFEIGLSIGIHKYILVGNSKKKITKNDEKIISDCCEALVAAVFIDKGFTFTRSFILRIWKKNIDKSSITILDSKTKLQELSLKLYKTLPLYKILHFKGPKHLPTYKISVSIKNSKSIIGTGNSKQQAQQDGAKKLLKEILVK
jgi:ribonuclease III